MFTGIVEEMGVIRSIRRGVRSAVLSIGAETVLSDLKLGDSVAVNGVCLTATSVDGGGFTADVMHETLRRSSLGALIPGSPVNLERAMAADGRFGGHIVSGHIDGTGTIASQKREDNAVWVKIKTPAPLLRYIVEKGSIAIDGVSLTVAAVTDTENRSVSTAATVREMPSMAMEPFSTMCRSRVGAAETVYHTALSSLRVSAMVPVPSMWPETM